MPPRLTPPAEIDRAFASFRESGSARELAAVYDALAPELLRLALHLTSQASDAEDVLQATFVAAIERAQSYDPARRVLPWMTGILANEARELRRRRGLPPDPERLEQRTQPSPDATAEARELDESLLRALERVPEAFRAVLRLAFLHGLSTSEIAAALDRPDGTVRSQLARGTEHLRRLLPLGLAGLAGACTTRAASLAAIRARVLAHPALSNTPYWLLPPLGVLAMKKLLAAAVAVLVFVALWRTLRPTEAPPPIVAVARPAATVEFVQAPRNQPEPVQEREPAPAAANAAPTRTTPAPVATSATLLVTASYPDGTPAAGEVVLLLTTRYPRLDQPLTARTDDEGLARLELEPGSVFVRLLRGAEQHALLTAGRETRLALALRAGVHVRGRVLDRDGRAVAAARIWLSERYRTNLGHALATSDAEGRFELRCVGPDHWLGAQKRGFAPGPLVSVRGSEGAERELVLVLEDEGALLDGRVLAADGTPVAGAELVLGAEQPQWVRTLDGSFVPDMPPVHATSAADGSFEFDGAPPGRLPLAVRASGAAPWSVEVELLAGTNPALTVRLVREARVVGRVLDAAGVPRSVQVGAGAVDTLAGVTGWSGNDGSFELTGVATGTVTVWARDGAEEARAELELAPGETRHFEARLALRPRIRGRVVDARGAPVGGLTVVAVWPEAREMRSRSQPSDGEGRFEIGPLEERGHQLMVHPPEGWRGFPLVERLDVLPSEEELLLILPEPASRASLVGEVLAPDGTPVGGAELGLWHDEAAAWRGFVSDEAGRFAATDLPPGHVTLELRHPLHAWLPLGTRTLAAGERLELGTLVFAPAGSVRVELAGARGAELRGLTTLLVRADATQRESGALRLDGDELVSGALAEGRHALRLGADGYAQLEREFEVRAGVETRLELFLQPAGARTVRLLLPDGAPPPAWIGCGLYDASGAQVWRGSAELGGPAPRVRMCAASGEHVLRVWGPDGLAGKLQLTLPAPGAELPELELLLSRQE